MTISKFHFTQETAETFDENGKRLARADAQQLCNLLYGGRMRDVGLLPPAVRWLSANGAGVALERPPGHALIMVDQEIHEIYLPWTLWVILFDSPNLDEVVRMMVFAQNYPLTSEADALGLLPLPGVMPDGGVNVPDCSGFLSRREPLGYIVGNVVETYLGTPLKSEEWYFEDAVPSGWPTTPIDVVKHMTNASHMDVTFSKYKPAPTATLAELLESIEPKQADPEADVLEFLGRMVEIAGKAQ